jgi:hypothetical protein
LVEYGSHANAEEPLLPAVVAAKVALGRKVCLMVSRSLRVPVLWGAVVGGLQAASPLTFWWLDAAAVYALGWS